MSRKGYILALPVILVLAFLSSSWLNRAPMKNSAQLLEKLEEMGIRLYAPLDDVQCGKLEESSEPGRYLCLESRDPAGFESVILYSLDMRLIHAIEVVCDPSTATMSQLAEKLKKPNTGYNLLYEEDSIVLFASDPVDGHGPTFLALKRSNAGTKTSEKLFLILMTLEFQGTHKIIPEQNQ
jgi:hypothetical protein